MKVVYFLLIVLTILILIAGCNETKHINYNSTLTSVNNSRDLKSSSTKANSNNTLLNKSSSSVSQDDKSTENSLYSKRLALDSVFNFIYSSKDKDNMKYIKFSDSPKFYGYEYQFNGSDSIMHIEFFNMLQNNQYYEFWLCEQVYYDGIFDHAATSNFFAVGIKTHEVIQSRIFTNNDMTCTNNPLYPGGAH